MDHFAQFWAASSSFVGVTKLASFSGSTNRLRDVSGDEDKTLDIDEYELIGDFSSSDTLGLGGNEARIISSSFSMHDITLCFSTNVIFCRASITLSRGSLLFVDAGDEWVEPEEVEEGDGVSRTGIKEASRVGLSVVMILETAMRLGGYVARPKWE